MSIIGSISPDPNVALLQTTYAHSQGVQFDPGHTSGFIGTTNSPAAVPSATGYGGASRTSQMIVNDGVSQILNMVQAASSQFDIVG